MGAPRDGAGGEARGEGSGGKGGKRAQIKGDASWRNKKSERCKPRSNTIVAPGKATLLYHPGTKPTYFGHVLSWAHTELCYTSVFVFMFNELPKRFVDALCAKTLQFSPVYLYNFLTVQVYRLLAGAGRRYIPPQAFKGPLAPPS